MNTMNPEHGMWDESSERRIYRELDTLESTLSNKGCTNNVMYLAGDLSNTSRLKNSRILRSLLPDAQGRAQDSETIRVTSIFFEWA
jgi:hypothetical protein